MWRECLTAQALQNLLSGGFPALIDDGSAHFRTSQPIRQDSWQSTWRDTERKVEGPRGARWRDPGVQGGGQREHHETTRETQRGGRWRNSGEEGGGTQGCKVEELRGARWSDSREEGGGTQGCKVEANGSIMKQPVKHSGATCVKLYASWRVVRH